MSQSHGWSAIAGYAAALGACFGAGTLVWREIATTRHAGDALLSAMPGMLILGTFALGAVLVGRGWPRRVGREMRCGVCGYVMLEPRDRLVHACPECSNPWRYFGRSRRGERVDNPWLLIGGAMACALALAGGLYHGQMRARLIAGLPTPALIRHVEAPSLRSMEAWDTLSKRKLAVWERESLAQGLLSRRARFGRLDVRTQTWLDAEIAAGGLSAGVVARYFADLALLDVDLRTRRAVVWSPVDVSLGARARHSDVHTPSGRMWIVLDGYDVVGADALPDFPPMPFRLGMKPLPGRTHGVVPIESAGRQTRIEFTPDHPGRYIVRARGYFIVSPVQHIAAFDDDGVLTLDSVPVYSREFVVEREFEVLAPQ